EPEKCVRSVIHAEAGQRLIKDGGGRRFRRRRPPALGANQTPGRQRRPALGTRIGHLIVLRDPLPKLKEKYHDDTELPIANGGGPLSRLTEESRAERRSQFPAPQAHGPAKRIRHLPDSCAGGLVRSV